MNSVKINRLELLQIVRKNMDKHVTDYNESVQDYKTLVVKLAQTNLKLAKSGDMEKIRDIKSVPSAPVSYADSYYRAIRMLELSVEDVIVVEEDVFNQLVLDEWNWKRAFVTASAMYKSGF